MNLLKRILTGKNLVGQLLYGVIDALPIPNVLNPIRAALKATPNATGGDIARLVASKTDWPRLAVALVVSYLIISGRLTLEALTKALDTFNQVLALIG